MHSTIDSTAHSMPLSSLEQCICTASMPNIRPGRDSNPRLDRMSHRGRPDGSGASCAPSSLGQAHTSAYRSSLAVSSTTISYSVYVVILGVCLRFKPHWMFQIYKYVIKGHEESTSCSSLIHSHMFPLLDVLYRQVGNISFGQ